MVYRVFTHGGNVWAYGGPDRILDFSSNINPLGPPKLLNVLLYEALDKNIHTYYPEPSYYELKRGVSSFLNVKSELIEVFNGASEAIFQIAYALKPSRIILTPPSYSEYWRVAQALGKRVHEIPYIINGDKFILDVDKLIKALNTVRDSLVYICNPNNPTGTLTDKRYLEEIIESALTRNSHVVVDESFMKFTDIERSVLDLVEAYKNLHVIVSLTKIFAIPGMRIGVVVTNATRLFEDLLPPWRVNSIVSYALTRLLDRQEYTSSYIRDTKSYVKTEMLTLSYRLKRLGLKPYITYTNYILVSLPEGLSSSSLTKTLILKHKVLIRDASTIPGLDDHYIRISLRASKDNMVLVKSLEETLKC